MTKKIRVPFSRIRPALLRRSIMVLAILPMLACNWVLTLWWAVLTLVRLPLIVLAKIIMAPFDLMKDGFIDAWHGRAIIERHITGQADGATPAQKG